MDKLQKYAKYYDEDKFLKKLKKLAVRLGEEMVVRVLMLYFVLVSGKVPLKIRLLIIAAFGYLIMPSDLVSDFIPAMGFADDVAFLAYTYDQTVKYMDKNVRKKAEEKLQSWFPLQSGKQNKPMAKPFTIR